MTTPALTPKSPELSLPRTQNAPSPAGTAPLKERVHDALEAIGRVFKVQRNIGPATPSELKQGVQLRENAVQALDRLRDGLGELGNQRPELL